MIAIRYLYTGINDLENFYNLIDFDCGNDCLIKIYTSELTTIEAYNLANAIKTRLPDAEIFGVSSSSIIFKGDIIENGTMILVDKYEKQRIKKEIVSWEVDSTTQIARECSKAFEGEDIEFIHILISDEYPKVHNFVNEFNKIAPNIKLVGGLLSKSRDNHKNAFIFSEKGIHVNSILMYTVIGEKLNYTVSCNNVNDPISSVYEVTKMNGLLIEEIENEDAMEWLRKFLKLNNIFNELNKNGIYKKYIFTQYFMALLVDNDNAGRYIHYDLDKKKLSLHFSHLDSGAKFRIGFINPNLLKESSYNTYKSIEQRDVESLFFYICDSRRLFLKELLDIELAPVKNTDVCGIFLFGEIANKNNKNQFFNGTVVGLEIAEKPSKLKIDINSFADSSNIDIDKSIIDFVMYEKCLEIKKQSDLIDNLTHSGGNHLPNTLQFVEDNKIYEYDKATVIFIENADIIIGLHGYNNYNAILLDIINQIENKIVQNFNLDINCYLLNYSTILMTTRTDISDNQFTSVVKNLYKNLRILKSQFFNTTIVLKYVVVFGRHNLLDKSIFALQKAKKYNLSFMEYRDDNIYYEEREQEALLLLKEVLQNKNIVPYYQGIYDNHSKTFTHYESLMRIKDRDGNIYPPYYFLNVAMKYELYLDLSILMINKVLEDFKNRSEYININLSTIDMSSVHFCNWFWHKISKYPHPEKIVIEIVENDEMEHVWESVEIFLNKAREYNMSIAIDDFGKYHSSLMRILKVKPDYIKLDGCIVKEILTNNNTYVIIRTVKFLSENMNAKIVAEFVEDKKIQKAIQNENIDYSQGYYFSKPKPIEEI